MGDGLKPFVYAFYVHGSRKFASSTRFYPTRGKGVEFIQLLLVLNGGCDKYFIPPEAMLRILSFWGQFIKKKVLQMEGVCDSIFLVF